MYYHREIHNDFEGIGKKVTTHQFARFDLSFGHVFNLLEHHPIDNIFHLRVSFKDQWGQGAIGVRSHEVLRESEYGRMRVEQKPGMIPFMGRAMGGAHVLFTGDEDSFANTHQLAIRDHNSEDSDLVQYMDSVLNVGMILSGKAEGYVDDMKLVAIGYFTR